MEIKDYIKCDNDKTLFKQSKMIANLLLSNKDLANKPFCYSEVSEMIDNHYNYHISYNKRFDKPSFPDDSDVGYYAGELSILCYKLGLPLISVGIGGKDNNLLPGRGFIELYKHLTALNEPDEEIIANERQKVDESFKNNDWQKLINYLNNQDNACFQDDSIFSNTHYFWVNQRREYPENKKYVQAPYDDNESGHKLVSQINKGDKILSYIAEQGGVFRVLTAISFPEKFQHKDGGCWCRVLVEEFTDIVPINLSDIKVLLQLNLNLTPKNKEETPWNNDFSKVKQRRYLTEISKDLFELLAKECKYPQQALSNRKIAPKILEQKERFEGEEVERRTLTTKRNREVVIEAKNRDKYSCVVCGFKYKNKIVEAHHLMPLSTSNGIKRVTKDDLITLCPNCHAIAHMLLKENMQYSDEKILIEEIRSINSNLVNIK